MNDVLGGFAGTFSLKNVSNSNFVDSFCFILIKMEFFSIMCTISEFLGEGVVQNSYDQH